MALFIPVFPLQSFLSTLRRPTSGGWTSDVPPGTIYFQWDFKDVSDNYLTLEYDGHENLLTKLFDAAAKMVSEDFVRLYTTVDGKVQEILTEEKLLKAILQQHKKGPVQLLTPANSDDLSTGGSFSTPESLVDDLSKHPISQNPSSTPCLPDSLDLSFINDDLRPPSPQSTYDEDFYGHLEAYGIDVLWMSCADILPFLAKEYSGVKRN